MQVLGMRELVLSWSWARTRSQLSQYHRAQWEQAYTQAVTNRCWAACQEGHQKKHPRKEWFLKGMIQPRQKVKWESRNQKKKKKHDIPKSHHSIGHAVKNAAKVHVSLKQFLCHPPPPTLSNRLMKTKSHWVAHSAWIFQTEFFSLEDVRIPQGQRTKVGNILCQPTQYALCSSPMW